MGSYLQQYGVGDEKRGRVIRNIIWAGIAVVLIAIFAYFVFHNFPETRVAKRFLADVNAKNYQAAYQEWGCTAEHPCPNYNFDRFMQDWGPSSKASSPWRIASTDSCNSFLTVNVDAQGAELQSLAIQRSDLSLGYAPAPECQERKWRWKQFFQRLTGHEPKQQ